ncbi:hypothetical protein ACHAPK_002774 [Fusarium culmorum]
MSAVASSQSGDVGKDTSGPSRRPNISPGGTVGPANTRDVGTQTDDFTLASFLVYRRGLKAVLPSPLRGTNGRHSSDPTSPSPISISSDEEEESNDTGGLHANPQDVNVNALETMTPTPLTILTVFMTWTMIKKDKRRLLSGSR